MSYYFGFLFQIFFFVYLTLLSIIPRACLCIRTIYDLDPDLNLLERYLGQAMCIQLFRERLSETNVHARIPKGNMGYDQYTVPYSVAVKPTCCFSFIALANIQP